MAFPPFLEKFISGPLSPIPFLLSFFPQTASPQAEPDPWVFESMREESLLFSLLSGALLCLTYFQARSHTAERLLPLSAAHRHNLYCTALQPQQKETDQPLPSGSADVLSTSLTKRAEDLTPGIASPLAKGNFLKTHLKLTCLRNGRAYSFP